MNKFSPILALAFLLIPAVSYAVEGTCSSHGGVNCSAGMDIDGSAICNDGWRDSNELFDKTMECSDFQHMCSQLEWDKLSSIYNLGDQIQKINDVNVTIKQKADQFKAATAQINQDSVFSGFAEGEKGRLNNIAAAQLGALSAIAQGLQVNYNLSFYQAESECYLLGNSEYAEKQTSIMLEQIKLQTQTQPQFPVSDPYTPIRSVKLDFGPAMSNDERCSKLNLGTWFNTNTQNCDTCPAGKEKDSNSNNCVTPVLVKPIVQQSLKPTPPPLTIKKVVQPSTPIVITQEATMTMEIATSSIQVATKTTISEPPLPPPTITPPPSEHPKTFWTKVINWFKFW